MMTPDNPRPITHRTGLAAVVDLGLLPDDLVEQLVTMNAVRASFVPPGDYMLVLDDDGLGVRGVPLEEWTPSPARRRPRATETARGLTLAS